MENFECKICDYITSRSNDMKKHEKSQKHLRQIYQITYDKKCDIFLNRSDVITKKIANKKSQKISIDDKNSQIYAKNAKNANSIDDKNSQDVIYDLNEKKPTKKQSKCICNCGKYFSHQSSLSRHKKTCDEVVNRDPKYIKLDEKMQDKQALEIQELKHELAKMAELIKHMNTNTNNENSLNTMTHSNNTNKLYSDNTITNTINNNNKISVIAYLNSNYNEAPPIKMLEKADITKLLVSDKLGDHSIAEWIVFENNHCRLHDFLGEFILKEFKKMTNINNKCSYLISLD